MGLVVILVERVVDAFNENLFGILRSGRTFGPWNCTRKAKILEECDYAEKVSANLMVDSRPIKKVDCRC